MSATDFATFVDGLAGLTVTGVTTNFDHTPQQLSTANLPALFMRLPDGADGPLTLAVNDQGGWPMLACEIVIAVEPYGLHRPRENFRRTVALIDNLNAALRGIKTGEICKAKIRWSIRGEQPWIGDQQYWAVIARVTGNG